MDKLKNKVFWVIFLILTIFTTSVLGFYNAQSYNRERIQIVRNLNQIEKFGRQEDAPFGNMPPNTNSENAPEKTDDEKPEMPELENIRYMDNTVYTVTLTDDSTVSEVINHSSNGETDEEIQEIANGILAQNKQSKIGNLYFCKYSYTIKNNTLTIVDNSETNSNLLITIIISLGILLLLELLILFISTKLTNWIIKPVQESFDKQKQFIADASHELKTPLAVIMASSEALESNPGEEEKWLANIKSESDRMNKLISDLLDLAKSEAVDDKSEFAVGNLSKTVETSVLTLEGLMFEKGITLDYDIDDNIEMNMNSYKIKQLISILLDNAIKHSEKGGEIQVNLKKDKDIVLTVSNFGEGIPKGEEEKIFERFYRADEARNRNENRYGLGLAIAKNIVLSHGGTISASSENGKTTFKTVFK